jgi:membrane protein implicated in regulation of membrane protease activity
MNKDTATEVTNQPSYNDSTYPTPPAYEESHEPLIPTRYVVIGVIISLALMIGFIAFVLWAARYHAVTIEALRDIFIIVLALESCLFGIALMILLVMVIRLVNMLEFEIKPILERTNETIGMVKGTTTFVSDNVVKPMTTASSYAAGIRRGLKTLFGNPKKNLD